MRIVNEISVRPSLVLATRHPVRATHGLIVDNKCIDIVHINNRNSSSKTIIDMNDIYAFIVDNKCIDIVHINNRLTTAIPIIDMNDIYAFIVDNQSMSRANWMPCREYQAWAYRDFIYDTHRSTKKSYMSRYSSYLAFTNTILANQIVTIDLPDLNPNIIFNVSRNENNSVYFERNDASGSRVRMCDNEYARAGYLGFYTRLTMDPGIIVIPPPPGAGPNTGSSPSVLLSTSHLPPLEETDDESLQCILCNSHQVNVKFSPCEHKISCSGCYSKMTKNECPVCRSTISRLMNL